MANAVPTLVQRQIARVSRRLFAQTLLDSLVACWIGALALSAVWFLIQLYLLGVALSWHSWLVVGGAVAVGSVAAVVLAVIRAPTRLAAALSLDEQFGLKERVTTTLTLAPGLEQTPAGQALLADVTERVAKLDVPGRFPIRVRWSAALIPTCVTLLVLATFFLTPFKGQTKLQGAEQPQPLTEAEKKELQQNLARVIKKPEESKAEDPQEKSKELQKIEAELEKIVNRPHDTKQALEERAKEITDLEKEMQKREKELQDKMQALKQQLANIDKGNRATTDPEGPAKEMQKALEKGDFKKALDEAEKLTKKLEKNELTKEEKQQLEKQLQNLKDQLEKLSEQKDEEEQLKELSREGKLDQDALDRELDNLKKNSEELKDMQDVAEALQECKQCMGKGDSEGAAKAMKKAAGKLQQLKNEGKESDELRDQMQALQNCKQCMGNCLGQNSSKFPGQRRPETKEGEFKAQNKQERVDFDAKGRKEMVDLVPGRSFKKTPSAEMAGEVQQASQEAPEAMERQKIPRAASDMAKGYYERLREQAEKDQKPANP